MPVILGLVGLAAVVTVLATTGRLSLPFMGPSASGTTQHVETYLDELAKGGEKQQRTVSCSGSDALDDVLDRNGHFDAAFTCDISWVGGGDEQWCFFTIDSRVGAGVLRQGCEAAARSGGASRLNSAER